MVRYLKIRRGWENRPGEEQGSSSNSFTEIEVYDKKNIGRIEWIARIVVGAGIMSLAFIGPQSPWALLGAFPFVTGLIGWCPPYALLGINTCGK